MEKIDFVITWVDGNDPAWQEEKRQYTPGRGTDDTQNRYQDWDNLQYWFRGVEKFAPWVNRIYFVTWGHVPAWLNTEHPKLRVIKHTEFMKAEYLPTFNINPIELNFHRIKELSEQFVFFNDDMFLLKETAPTYFFRNGKPCDSCVETALVQDQIDNPFASILMNDAAILNMHYDKRSVIKAQRKKWFSMADKKGAMRNLMMYPYHKFSSFKYSHQPSALKKSTYEKVWAAEPDRLDEICHHRFRTVFDVNQYLIKYWQYVEGEFEPQSMSQGAFYTIGPDDAAIEEVIKNQSAHTICLNDDGGHEDFEAEKEKIKRYFQEILPERSAYEKE